MKVNLQIKKAVALAETMGCELKEFDENSASFCLKENRQNRYRKSFILLNKLFKIEDIETSRTETSTGFNFFVKGI